MLLLNINGTACMGSPLVQLNWTLVKFERSVSRALRLRRLICCKRAELGHVLLLKHQYEIAYGMYGESNSTITFYHFKSR